MVTMSQKIDNVYPIFHFDTTDINYNNADNGINIQRVFPVVSEKSQALFTIKTDAYKFSLKRNRLNSNIENIIVILSKDNASILDHTLNILINNYNLDQKYDILLVDDRSVSQDILNLSDKYSISYLRIDNDANIFNYSNLNNIAALYAAHYNKKLIIFYNNDLWPDSVNTIDNLVNKHLSNKSDISGCKLLYPTKISYEYLGKPTHFLQNNLDQIFDTIQHGGIYFTPRQSSFFDPNRKYYGGNISLRPSHLWRFYNRNTILASTDSRCYAVTGAIQIINTDTFIKLGGFNTSLCSAFQDIDLCLKAIEHDLSVYYFGSEFMYHAESLTQAVEKDSFHKIINLDNIMWDALWGIKLPTILGYQK